MLEGKLEYAQGKGENIGMRQGGKASAQDEENSCERGARSQVNVGCLLLSQIKGVSAGNC